MSGKIRVTLSEKQKIKAACSLNTIFWLFVPRFEICLSGEVNSVKFQSKQTINSKEVNKKIMWLAYNIESKQKC